MTEIHFSKSLIQINGFIGRVWNGVESEVCLLSQSIVCRVQLDVDLYDRLPALSLF